MEDIEWGDCPGNIVGGIRSWYEHGTPPGGFLWAVLTNDLFEAFKAADRDNAANLGSICNWIWWNLPTECYGNAKKCERWEASKRASRMVLGALDEARKGEPKA